MTSSPTRVEPSPVSEKPFWRCFRLWSGHWLWNSKGPLTLLTHYQTPAQLRRAGHKRVAAYLTYLRSHGVKGSNNVAQEALSAAKAQSVSLPAQEVASRIVAELAGKILALEESIEGLDEELKKRFFRPPRGSDSH